MSYVSIGGGALPSPCATDTTDDATRITRSSKQQQPMSYGGIMQPQPVSLSSGVSLGRIMAVVGSSLALVAVLTVASHRSMTVAGQEQMLSSSVAEHPRLAKMQLSTARFGTTYDKDTETPVLGGVDVVAFFDMEPGGAPVYGDAAYSYTLRTSDDFGTTKFKSTFFFATKENLAAFEEDPAAYAPRYGGWCAFGISSEMNSNLDSGMDEADIVDGWSWARDYLGPPANVESWAIVDGKLYFTFLPEVMTAFLAGGADLALAGEERWASWFGETEDGLQKGPFNVECLAEAYGPPVTRTCTWQPQANSIMAAPVKPLVSSVCGRALAAQCGDKQGNDPVQLDLAETCSQCLLDNFDALKAAGCAATDTAVSTTIDKAYCW